MAASRVILLAAAVGLTGCLPGSGRKNDRALSPADSASIQLATTVPVDTLELAWTTRAPDDDPMPLPTSLGWMGDGRIAVVETQIGSIRLFGADSTYQSRVDLPEQSYPYFAGASGDTVGVLARGSSQLLWTVPGEGVVQEISVGEGALNAWTSSPSGPISVRFGGGTSDEPAEVRQLDAEGTVIRTASLSNPWRASGFLRSWGDSTLALSGYRPVVDVIVDGQADTLALQGFDSPQLPRSAQFMRGDANEPPLLTSSADALERPPLRPQPARRPRPRGCLWTRWRTATRPRQPEAVAAAATRRAGPQRPSLARWHRRAGGVDAAIARPHPDGRRLPCALPVAPRRRAMSRSRSRRTRIVLGGLVAFGTLIYLVNTSRLASPVGDELVLLAHRGLGQDYSREGLTNETCTAERLIPIGHSYLENTLPSMQAAFELGADVVEFDVHRTTDDSFAVFHDWTVDCRTDGSGVTHELALDSLQQLDIGYGYTADGGQTYPFRGQGIGMMPSMDTVLTTFPDRRFLIDLKSNKPSDGAKASSRSSIRTCSVFLVGGTSTLPARRNVRRYCSPGVVATRWRIPPSMSSECAPSAAFQRCGPIQSIDWSTTSHPIRSFRPGDSVSMFAASAPPSRRSKLPLRIRLSVASESVAGRRVRSACSRSAHSSSVKDRPSTFSSTTNGAVNSTGTADSPGCVSAESVADKNRTARLEGVIGMTLLLSCGLVKGFTKRREAHPAPTSRSAASPARRRPKYDAASMSLVDGKTRLAREYR